MNLNELITDEDEDVVDNLSTIESTDENAWLKSDLYKSVDKLFSAIESIKNKTDLLNYIQNKSYINKKLAKEMVLVYSATNKFSVEAYTDGDSKVNYRESVIFMDADINREKDSAITILKDVFEKGVDQCETLYDEYVNVIRPRLEETFNEIYLGISNSLEKIDLNSILFYNDEAKAFVNVSPMSLKEIQQISGSLSDIPDDTTDIHFETFYEAIKDLLGLIEKNKVILKTLIVISNAKVPISMDEIYQSTLIDNDIALMDLFHFYMSSKGQFYINNAQSLLDYVVNLVSFKRGDYQSIIDKPNAIASFAFSVESEVIDIKKALEFMQDFINGMIDFLRFSKALFKSLHVL